MLGQGRVLLGESLFGPGFVAGDLLFDLFRIGSVVAKNCPQLGFGQPMVGTAKTCKVTAEALIRGNDLPDIEAGAGKAGSAAGGTIGEDNTGTTAHLDGFGQQRVGHSGKVTPRGVCRFLNGLGEVFGNSETLSHDSHNYLLFYYRQQDVMGHKGLSRLRRTKVSCRSTMGF